MESSEKINYCRYVVPHEEENPINSNVIVKLQTVLCAKFSKLQCNTNLNLPPSNWLTNAGNSYGLQRSLSPSKGFSSFRMAHMFPDCLCEIDVVSSAENIKNLLKLPYSPKSTISMMVHRIENTLLIDDFDLYKFLLQQADNDWKWLRQFIIENLSPKDRSLLLKNYCSKENFEQKKLLSKFLYHSLSNENPIDDTTTQNSTILQEINTGPLLPDVDVDENVPEHGGHIFNRNVMWTFEDIRMLIGTDMPIFGNGTQPCISLKLRDMSKPINVLTGIDYWLDNLMCNVPEVVMCYHLDGLVQKYELIKTEDLPYLENSKFSPKVIRNVAQNILSFLNGKATKAGHTYWLFKGSNDDFVKLYDLTSLCMSTDEGEKNDKEADATHTANLENPFTVPVAMLLYKVAKNMKNMTENMSAKQAGSIKALLDNCIQLLPKEKYPQIVTSSHYILSDIFIPANIDPSAPTFYPDDNHINTQSEYEDGNSASVQSDVDKESASEEIALQNICDTVIESNLEKNWKHNSSPPPIVSDVKERCLTALHHIAEGLSCLQFFSQTEEKLTKEKEELDKENEKRKIILEELNPHMAKPSVPIPLHYEKLKPEAQQIDANCVIPMRWKTEATASGSKSNRKTKKKKKKNQSMVDEDDSRALLLKDESGVIHSWNVHLKLLLLEKACLIYATLAEQFYHEENFGKTLRFIMMALNCQKIVTKHMKIISYQKVCLLGRAGDCYFQMANNVDAIHINLMEFHSYSSIDLAIKDELIKDIEKSDLPDPTNSIEALMCASLNCYEAALEMLDPSDEKGIEFIRRIGNVQNELGVKCMYWAQDEYVRYKNGDDTVQPDENGDIDYRQQSLYELLAKKSYNHLLHGIKAFEGLKDDANLAILLCNMGRFYRFRANIDLPGDIDSIAYKRKMYEKAFYHYNRALGIIGSRKDNTELWDIVTWELSTSTFTLAQLTMDNAKTFNEEESNDIIDLLQRSLKLCEHKSPGPRKSCYLYRKSLIHSRLGKVFFHLQESNQSDMKRLHSQLCNFHYDKAVGILRELSDSVEDAMECLIIQIKQIELHNIGADDFTNPITRIEYLRLGVWHVVNSKFIFDLFLKHHTKINEDIVELMEKFEQLLQTILKKAIKHSMKVAADNLINFFKDIYVLTLRKPEKLSGQQMAQHLAHVLDQCPSAFKEPIL